MVRPGAYSEIATLGDDCRMGRDAEARAWIRKIGAALGQATQRLAPYGLIP